MGTQSIVNYLIVYYIFLIAISTLFYMSGFLGDESVYIENPGIDGVLASNVTDDLPSGDVGLFSSFSFSGWFKTLFSVFVFDLNMVGGSGLLAQYFWVIRILLVWLPGVFGVLSVYYSLPTVNG